MRNTSNTIAAGLLILLAATACAAAQQLAVKAGQIDSGYVLGPDDQIVIRSVDTPEISEKPILIGTNDNITLPMVGRVKAGGLTVEQLETDLNRRLREYVRDPQVSVSVVEFKSQPVSVFGAVTKPGVVQLRGRKTLYEVLSMAGGPRETAGPSVTVTRRRENGDIPLPSAITDQTGRYSIAELNVQEILEGKNPTANIEIRPNDVVSVSEASSSMVYVVGDVQRAGAFSLGGRQSLSVLSALSLAGGLGHTAKADKARIIRSTPGQTQHQEIVINIKQVLAGKAEDVGLRAQDVLVVPTSSGKSFVMSFLPNTLSNVAAAALYHY